MLDRLFGGCDGFFGGAWWIKYYSSILVFGEQWCEEK